jgi:hypothetical protein
MDAWTRKKKALTGWISASVSSTRVCYLYEPPGLTAPIRLDETERRRRRGALRTTEEIWANDSDMVNKYGGTAFGSSAATENGVNRLCGTQRKRFFGF